MNVAIAFVAGLVTIALAIAGIVFISRRFHLLRQLRLTLFVGACAAGLTVFNFLSPELLAPEDRQHFDDVLHWLLILTGIIAILQIAGLYFFEVYLYSHRGLRLPPLLPFVTKGLSYVIAILITLKVEFPDLDVTGLLAASAITSLVLGLALQPILGNFFSGLVISLEKPFRINDWIELDGVEGLVTDITWRTTHLRTRDNDSLVIPNSSIAGQQVTNYYYPHPLHLERIHVGVHYRTPPYRVREALLESAKAKGVLDKPTPEIHLMSFDDSAMTYELRIWLEDHAQKPRIVSDVKESIWENFRKRGIVIPFPIRTLEFAPQIRPLEVLTPATDERIRPAPAAQLFVAQGPDQGHSLSLDGNRVTVGRSHKCQFTLRERQASKEHLEVEFGERGYLLRDLESQFGTRVNGIPVKETILRDLDRISIGDTEIVFELEHHG